MGVNLYKMLTMCSMTRQKKCPTRRENEYASNMRLRIGYSVIVFVRQRGVWRRVLWTAHRTPHGVMDFSAGATTHPWLRRNNSISECTQYATGTPEMHHLEYSIEGMCWRCLPMFFLCFLDVTIHVMWKCCPSCSLTLHDVKICMSIEWNCIVLWYMCPSITHERHFISLKRNGF